MPAEEEKRTFSEEEEAYTSLVRQWEAVSHTLDLMREHDITLSQNEQWHSELEAKAFELSVREQALTHDRALPFEFSRAWFRQAQQDETGLRKMRASLLEHQAELATWERDTRQAWASQFPGYPYTHEGIAEAIASLKPLEADLRNQIGTYHNRSLNEAFEQRMTEAKRQLLEWRVEQEWQHQRTKKEEEKATPQPEPQHHERLPFEARYRQPPPHEREQHQDRSHDHER